MKFMEVDGVPASLPSVFHSIFPLPFGVSCCLFWVGLQLAALPPQLSWCCLLGLQSRTAVQESGEGHCKLAILSPEQRVGQLLTCGGLADQVGLELPVWPRVTLNF